MPIAVEIEVHRTGVDQQHGPIVMRVHRVRVSIERCVQHFPKPWHRRVPGADEICHARNVQDLGGATPQNRSMTSLSPASTAAPVYRFDTKVAVVLRDGLAPWQELNITAFVMSGIATSEDDLVGDPYRDGDGNAYLPMLREPVLVMTADAGLLAEARARAAARSDVALAVYTGDLFATTHDEANRAAVAAVPARDLDLVGIALRGPKNTIDRLLKGARMHA